MAYLRIPHGNTHGHSNNPDPSGRSVVRHRLHPGTLESWASLRILARGGKPGGAAVCASSFSPFLNCDDLLCDILCLFPIRFSVCIRLIYRGILGIRVELPDIARGPSSFGLSRSRVFRAARRSTIEVVLSGFLPSSPVSVSGFRKPELEAEIHHLHNPLVRTTRSLDMRHDTSPYTLLRHPTILESVLGSTEMSVWNQTS